MHRLEAEPPRGGGQSLTYTGVGVRATRKRKRCLIGLPATDEPAQTPGSCYSTGSDPWAYETSWRSRTISTHESKGSWRESRVSRRSSSAEVVAPPASLTPARKLILWRMRRVRQALPSRAADKSGAERLPPVARFERAAWKSVHDPERVSSSRDRV